MPITPLAFHFRGLSSPSDLSGLSNRLYMRQRVSSMCAWVAPNPGVRGQSLLPGCLAFPLAIGGECQESA
jgi:hypothetical protein